MIYVKAVFFICIGYALIFVGVTFLSQQLLPNVLNPLYNLPIWLKLTIFAVVVSIPANVLIASAYQTAGALFAGVTASVVFIVGAIIVACLVDGAKLNLNIVFATLLMLSGAVWVCMELDKTTKVEQEVASRVHNSSEKLIN